MPADDQDLVGYNVANQALNSFVAAFGSKSSLLKTYCHKQIKLDSFPRLSLTSIMYQ